MTTGRINQVTIVIVDSEAERRTLELQTPDTQVFS